MNKFLQRVIAYVVDILVVSIFATGISNIGFINFQLKDYNEVYHAYTKDNKEYSEFVKDFKSYYKDKKITEEETQKLEKNYKNYYSLVEKKYEDKEISKKEYNGILEEAEDKYEVLYKDYYYQIKKYSILTNIIYVVVILLYFVGFQLLTGQTLGKKIMKLKVASIKGDGKVKPMQYFIRALILYNTVFYLIDVFVVLTVGKNNCYNVLYAFGLLQNVIEWIILFMIAMNQDGRGLHDLLASTIVLGIDENNDVKKEKVKDAKYEEVEKAEHKDATVEEVTEVETGMKEKKKELKPVKKKTVKKDTAKKTTTKKTSTTQKKATTKKTTKKESK